MWIARVDTGRYEFEAYGESEEEALVALHAGVDKHLIQCGHPELTGGFWATWGDEVNVYEAWDGWCRRDREILCD